MSSESDGRLKDEEGALHVLFICTGNICRSPTAERLALAYGAQLQIPHFFASSAGTRAVIAHPMHEEAALVLKSLGADPSDFAARQLTPRIAANADLILTMTRSHRDRVLELAPNRLKRTFTLSEASRLVSDHNAQSISDLVDFRPQLKLGGDVDIADPIGQSSEVFADIGTHIAELLPPVMELCRRASRPVGAEPLEVECPDGRTTDSEN